MPALAARPWTEEMPQTGDPDTGRYARELAEAMENRARRLGEQAAGHPPAWARPLRLPGRSPLLLRSRRVLPARPMPCLR